VSARRRGVRRTGAGLLLLGLLLTLAESAGATDPTPPEPRTIPELEQAFGIANIHSDFVVVIDTSGSMSSGPDPLYPKVRTAFEGLVDQLPEGDHLSVVTFDNFPTTRFNEPLVGAARQRAKDLPRDARGQNTDIGAALFSTLDRLERPDANRIQTVIFLTDGNHEPPPFSEFVQPGNDSWQRMQQRAAALDSSHSLQVRALALTDQGKAGAELVGQVFPRTEVARLDPAQLGDYLAGQVVKARLQVLATAVDDEVRSGTVKATVTSDGKLSNEVPAKVRLSSSLAHLGVDVDLQRISATDNAGKPVRIAIVGGSRTIHLPPAGTNSFRALLKPALASDPLVPMPPLEREEIDVQLDLAGTATAQPADLIRQALGVDPALKVRQPDPFTLGRDRGTTVAGFLLWCAKWVALGLALWWVYWQWIRKQPLVGELVPTDPGMNPDVVIRLHGWRGTMKLGPELFDRPTGTRIRVSTRRGRRNRKRVFAERIGIGGSFDVEKGRIEWKQFPSGGELTTVDHYRLGEGGVGFRWRRSRDHE